jgi:hypothetical protein
MLEDTYLQKHGEDVVPMRQSQPEPTDEPASLPTTVDSNKLLEVLKQDLKS